MSVLFASLLTLVGCEAEPPAPEAEPAAAVPESHPLLAEPLAEKRDRADLVFEGEVVDIQYRESADDRPVPHTFVTYRIDRPLKGGAAGETVTIRLIGGPTSNGQIMRSPHLPEFDLGDHDILLVNGNGTAWCPVVDCQGGRIRVIDGQAYGDEGHRLGLDDQGVLVRGPWRDLEEVRTTRIGERVFERWGSKGPERRPGVEDAEGVSLERLRSILSDPSSEAAVRDVGVDSSRPFFVVPANSKR